MVLELEKNKSPHYTQDSTSRVSIEAPREPEQAYGTDSGIASVSSNSEVEEMMSELREDSLKCVLDEEMDPGSEESDSLCVSSSSDEANSQSAVSSDDDDALEPKPKRRRLRR